MGRKFFALVLAVVTLSACGDGEFTQEELDAAVEEAVAEALAEADSQTTSTSTSTTSVSTSTSTTTPAASTTSSTTTTTTEAVELDETDPRNADAMEGNAAPPLASGDPGELTVINASYTVSSTFSSTRVQLVVRNNTDTQVYGVAVAMTIRDADGSLIATGNTDDLFPYWVDAGDIVFGQAFISDVELPSDAQFEFQVSSSDTDERIVSQNNLQVVEHGLQGENIVAILENSNDEPQQLAQAAAMCFLEDGTVSGYADGFADADILEVGETSPITLDIGDVECPIYLISSKAFDN